MGQGHDHTRFTPVDLVPFGGEITAAVKAFTAAERLPAPESYYHDLPVWIIHDSNRQQGRLRRVQVMVYLVNQTPYLSLVPSVDVCLSEHKVLVPKRCPAVCFQVQEVLKDDTLDVQRFTARLGEVWQQTNDWNPERQNMIEVDLTVVDAGQLP